MTDTIRRDTKQAVANLLQSTPGLKSVFTYRKKINVGIEFPLCVVTIPKAKEGPFTETRPIGRKRIDFDVQLEIYYQDSSPDGSGQLNFDDLLDAIDSQLRSQPNLNSATVGSGVVLASAITEIETTAAPPQDLGQTVGLLAVKQFEVTVQVTG